MSDDNAIFIVAILAFIFACLWIFNGRQKRRFEEQQRQRKRDLERIKREALEKSKE